MRFHTEITPPGVRLSEILPQVFHHPLVEPAQVEKSGREPWVRLGGTQQSIEAFVVEVHVGLGQLSVNSRHHVQVLAAVFRRCQRLLQPEVQTLGSMYM